MKPRWLWAKLAVSAGLMTYLIGSSNLEALLAVAGRVDLTPIMGAFWVMLGGVVISSYKWQALLECDGLHCGLGELTRYYLIGIFFNNFLPTSVGGDAVKAYAISRKYGRRMAAVSSVLGDRFSGVIALLAIGLVGIALIPQSRPFGPEIAVLLWASLAACLVLLGFMTQPASKLWRTFLPTRLWVYLDRFFQAVRGYFSGGKSVWTMAWVSLVFQLSAVLAYMLGAQGFDLDVTFTEMMVVVPLVTVATLLPISFNGLGIREGGFVLLLGNLGVGKEEALSLSLLIFGLTLLLSAVGGLLLLSSKSAQQMAVRGEFILTRRPGARTGRRNAFRK